MKESAYFEDGELYLSHRQRAYPWPQSIQIELTDSCNLRCVMCPVTVIGRPASPFRQFSLADLEAMREVFEHAYEVELAGFCEAFLHPQIIEILRFFRGCGLSVWITTNGMLLDPERSERIVAERLVDVLEVSVDAARPQTYEAVRRGGRFDTLLDNLRAFVEIRRRHKASTPDLRLLFLPMRPNLDELPAFCELAGEVGADRIVVQGMFVHERFPAARDLMIPDADRGRVRDVFRKAEAVARRLGIPIDFRWVPFRPDEVGVRADGVAVTGYQYTVPESDDRPCVRDCSYLWSKIFLKVNRDIQTCATLFEQGIMGNLAESDLSEIWHSPRYTQTRRRIAGTRPIPECVDCPNHSALRPHLPEELPVALDFGDPRTTLVGLGFYPPEQDERGRGYRWLRQEATFFLRREARHDSLVLELETHPRWSDLRGCVLLDGKEIGLFGGKELKDGVAYIRLPRQPVGPAAFTIRFDREITPKELGIGDDCRRLTARLYRAELVVAAGPAGLRRRLASFRRWIGI